MLEITVGAPVFIAFLLAVVNTLLGYFKTTPPENFEPGKFLGTVFIGVIVGFMTTAFGWTYMEVTEWLAASNLIVWIYWFAKIVATRLPNWKPFEK